MSIGSGLRFCPVPHRLRRKSPTTKRTRAAGAGTVGTGAGTRVTAPATLVAVNVMFNVLDKVNPVTRVEPNMGGERALANVMVRQLSPAAGQPPNPPVVALSI